MVLAGVLNREWAVLVQFIYISNSIRYETSLRILNSGTRATS